ncbi:hypothetical protein HALLA_12095 [Halostagnicola larsenii XH-48]|uniref:Uncharacterized protein n=1 Tax=Halostagnicola larsenii XH-48 TaxID=797299 RepID=W0JUD0_9EURY|nr:hypothetical protein [Halostagnicola larsenii]AHG00917.1 hypothetical protein HALLA_11795 [Halostagnicola larsenii XH-48]AHG00966.1 hypothetical protein HALLA_12095 [Halostagnicola larsenii XH-48]
MTIFSRRDESARAVDGEYHAFRERARKTAFSEEEFDPIDQERYDLDDAGIDGRDNPDTYEASGQLGDWEGDSLRKDPDR